MNEPKKYAVWIFDEESGVSQPMICVANGFRSAREQGIGYIRAWSLKGAYIEKIEVCDDSGLI